MHEYAQLKLVSGLVLRSNSAPSELHAAEQGTEP